MKVCVENLNGEDTGGRGDICANIGGDTRANLARLYFSCLSAMCLFPLPA